MPGGLASPGAEQRRTAEGRALGWTFSSHKSVLVSTVCPVTSEEHGAPELVRQLSRFHRSADLPFAALVLAYCWWASGTHPFTTVAYLAVGLPAVLIGGSLLRRPLRSPRPHPASAAVEIRLGGVVALLLVGICLEIAGLALGGRSPALPTLSTVLDHALIWHGTRFACFVAWLALGAGPLLAPAVRARRR